MKGHYLAEVNKRNYEMVVNKIFDKNLYNSQRCELLLLLTPL